MSAAGTSATDTAAPPSCVTSARSGGAVPASVGEALAAVRAGLAFLAGADAGGLTAAERAEALQGLGAAESVHLAARSKILTAFDAAQDHAADGQPTTRSWLRWQTRTDPAAAGAACGWARRLAAHPAVAAALAAGRLSVSWARRICDWLDQLPEDARDVAAEILVAAAAAGAGLADLAGLFEEIRARTAKPSTDNDDDRFARRRLILDTYYRGDGLLRGDLTAQAAAKLRAVLDAYNAKAGPEDTRTAAQRDHDALEEALDILLAGGQPGAGRQPIPVQVHMSLAELLGLPPDPGAAADSAAHGVPAPPGAGCDARIFPVVTASIDEELLADLISQYLHDTSPDSPGACASADGGSEDGGSEDSTSAAAVPVGEQTRGRAFRAARQLAIADAVRLLSGPGGLASWLRATALAGTPAGTPSLPLDTGKAADTVPAHIRRAVRHRDQHCRFPGCDRPPDRCHVHHLLPKADGGTDSVGNCCLVCSFHHLIAVHRWGWTLVLNPDGTSTASSPDGQRVLHSHAPPAAA